MSYILDALKKAERERGISRVPTLATIHELRKGRQRYLWIIAGAIVLSVAAFLWFFVASPKMITQPQPLSQIDTKPDGGAAPPPTEAVETSNSVKTPPPAGETPGTNHSATAANALSPNPGLPAYEAVTRKSAEIETKRGAAVKPATVSQENDQSSNVLEDASSDEEGADDDDSAVTAPAPDHGRLEKKPSSLPEAVEKMILNIHVYSNVKEERFVFINGKKYREGDYVDSQYLLQEITPEGAVLSHQGDKVILRPGRK
jgi:general secretion pathway protein B